MSVLQRLAVRAAARPDIIAGKRGRWARVEEAAKASRERGWGGGAAVIQPRLQCPTSVSKATLGAGHGEGAPQVASPRRMQAPRNTPTSFSAGEE